jgi:microcystin degradation protein MlrC
MLGHNLGMSTQSHDPEVQKGLPMVKIMEEVSRLEKESGILDISVFVGFAHADVQECGMSILVIGDDEPILAQSIAEKVADMVWEARWDFYNFRPLIPVEKAVQRAMESQEGPIILVDVADNSGGGAPCDNTVILETLLKKGAEDAVVPLRDPEAVEKAFEFGVGSKLELHVGGKIDKRFYKPVQVKVEVKLLSDGKYIIRGPHHGGYDSKGKILPKEAWKKADVGRMALLKTNGIEIIVSEGKVSMERDYYKAAGVDPSERKIVVVRSAQAHRASFEGISKEIIEVDTPGPCSAIYRGLIFKNIERPIFPLDKI